MAKFKMGRVVFNDRGYMVSELVAGDVPDGAVTGFSLIGPNASSSIIYSNPQEALEALDDIEACANGCATAQ